MEKKYLVIIIIIAFVLGAGAGILFQAQRNSPKLIAGEKLVKDLSSKTVSAITVYGQITKIEGRILTIDYSGSGIKVAMSSGADIYSFANDKDAKAMQKKIDFNEIKNGDNVSIAAKLLPDGKLEGQSLVVLRSFAK